MATLSSSILGSSLSVPNLRANEIDLSEIHFDGDAPDNEQSEEPNDPPFEPFDEEPLTPFETSNEPSIVAQDNIKPLDYDWSHYFTSDLVFATEDELLNWILEYGRKNMQQLVKVKHDRSRRVPRIVFGCFRGGVHRVKKDERGSEAEIEEKKKFKRVRSTRKCDCKFEVTFKQSYGVEFPKWQFHSMRCGTHNHPIGKRADGKKRKTVGKRVDGKKRKIIETPQSSPSPPIRKRPLSTPEHPFGIECVDEMQRLKLRKLLGRDIIKPIYLCDVTLEKFEFRANVYKLLDSLGMRAFVDFQEPAYPALTVEFLSSFSTDVVASGKGGTFKFRVANIPYTHTVEELAEKLLFPAEGIREFLSESNAHRFWRTIAFEQYAENSGDPTYFRPIAKYHPTQAKIATIYSPVFRYMLKLLGVSILGCFEVENCTESDLLFLWAMVNAKKLDLAYFLLKQLDQESERGSGGIVMGGICTLIAKKFGALVDEFDPQHASFIDEKAFVTYQLVKKVETEFWMLYAKHKMFQLPNLELTDIDDNKNWKPSEVEFPVLPVSPHEDTQEGDEQQAPQFVADVYARFDNIDRRQDQMMTMFQNFTMQHNEDMSMIIARLDSISSYFGDQSGDVGPSSIPPREVNHVGHGTMFTAMPLSKSFQAIPRKHTRANLSLARNAKMPAQLDMATKESTSVEDSDGVGIVSIHHVGFLCENLERSLEFYQNLLGLKINEARPHDKLPYRGAWLWVGSEMIHLMELPNPDPLTGRPEHGGRDRHACLSIKDVAKLKNVLDKAGIPYTLSKSGRPAIFTRDPDANALEFTQIES